MMILVLLLWQDPLQKDAEGWVIAPELAIVKGTCTGCHSGRLVLQNRGDRETWKEVIRLMQRDHNLWPLAPEVEEQVLDYLSRHLPPRRKARRTMLELPTQWLDDKDPPQEKNGD